jgi:hypothetical protein
MAFPITLTNAVDGTTIVAAALHNAVEAKIGIDSSAVVTSLDYLLKNSASVDPGHKHTKSGIICDVATGYVMVSGGVDAAAVWSATPTLTSLTTPTLYGSAASGGNLQLHSTSHATKGKIYLGSTATVDDVNGRFGVGTGSPSYKLTVYDDATHYIHIGKGAGGIAARTAQQWVGGTCTCNFDIIDDTHAWLGVVQNLPIHLGTNDLTRLTISGAGAIQFTAYGAGVLTTDASGNVTATGTPSIATSLTVPTVYGSAASAGDLLLSSTSHATKGKIKLGGDSFYFHQTLGCLVLGDSWDSEQLGHLDVRRATGVIASFGQTYAENPAYGRGQVYITPGSINSRYYYDNDGSGLYINYAGYLNSTSYYRSTWIGDGKNNNIATFDGANRRVGIGTTSPSYKLTVYDDATHYVHIGKGAGGVAARTAQQWVGGTCTCNFDIIDDTHAWLGVVQNLPIHLGTNNLTRLTISGAGAIQFTAYGAGALTTDASGNITAVSDMRHKQFRRLFAKGMAELQAIDPIVYKWRPESGMETEHEYVGFSAQNVQESLPEAVGQDSQGYLTLQDRAILAAVVNAVKGQQAQIDALMAQ